MNREDYDQYQAQSALTQQSISGQQMPFIPQMAEQLHESQAVLVEQTNPKKIVREVILRLEGLELKEDGSKVKVSEPKLNKVGIDNMWFILDSHVNQGVILSHLEKQEIGNIMQGLQEDIVDDLSLNWREYGIKKKTDLDTINNSILVNTFVALKRAQEQNEKNWLGKISVENISNLGKPPVPKKEGFWSKIRL